MKHFLKERFESSFKFYLLLSVLTQLMVTISEFFAKLNIISWGIFDFLSLIFMGGGCIVVIYFAGNGIKKKIISLLRYLGILFLTVILVYLSFYIFGSSLEKMLFKS